MADEDEVQAGLVEKGKEYPKSQAKVISPSEFSQIYQIHIWPPHPSEEQIAEAVRNWQSDARVRGFTPAKTADTEVSGEGGITYIEVTGRVRRATGKES